MDSLVGELIERIEFVRLEFVRLGIGPVIEMGKNKSL